MNILFNINDFPAPTGQVVKDRTVSKSITGLPVDDAAGLQEHISTELICSPRTPMSKAAPALDMNVRLEDYVVSKNISSGRFGYIFEAAPAPPKDLLTQLKQFTMQGEPPQLPVTVRDPFTNDTVNVSITKLATAMSADGRFSVIDGELCAYHSPIWTRLTKDTTAREIRRWIDENVTEGIPLRPRNINEIIDLLRTDPKLNRRSTDFISRQMLINCRNGIYDVRSGRIFPSSPSYGFFLS